MILDATDYDILYNMVFGDSYPGYKPNVIESPNGNEQWDTEKKYAHIAKKYLDQLPDSPAKSFMYRKLYDALGEAQDLARALGIPSEYHPRIDDSTIRILYYPPGAITHPHYDFDLFTTVLYRNRREPFIYLDNAPSEAAQNLSEQIHYGEILELIRPESKATYHEVAATDYVQKSIVFFAIPDHAAILPSGQTVGEWITERIARSRKEIA